MPVEESLDELERLADTAGLIVVGRAIQRFDQPDSATYIGSGKTEEIKMLVTDLGAGVVIFDDELLPRQQRELEERFGQSIKVVDRTALILDIFAQHAQTREGQLQVELAQLEYRLPRLTRMWTHLARQAGGRAGGASGGVGVRGPGEKQIEVDRREIGRRIAAIKEELEAVRAHRQRHRAKRQQTELKVVAIVGYTNAGKSTLLNKLTGADVIAEDRLFATLDPTTRRLETSSGRDILLTDTVGFIQKLPTQIVAAFRATLEEIADADVLLHVVDMTHPQVKAQIESVEDTLAELDLDHIPTVIALNKIDQLPAGTDVRASLHLNHIGIPVSAVTGEGLDELILVLEAEMERYLRPLHVHLPYNRGDLLAMLYGRGRVEHEEHTESGITIQARLPERLHAYFQPYLLTGV